MSEQIPEITPEMLDMQEALVHKQIIAGNKNYLKMLEKMIKEMEDFKPEDRLKYANGLRMVINAMAMSIQGWAKWCNLVVMDDMTLEELKKYYTKMKELCMEWLKCDYELTKTKTADMEKEEEKSSKKISKKGKKQPNLI